MKLSTIKQIVLGVMLGVTGMIWSTQQAQAASCCLTFSPPNNQLTAFVSDYFPDYLSAQSLFTITVSSGNAIPAGTYEGWCIDSSTIIDPRQGNTVVGTTYSGTLLSTCDTNELALIPARPGNPPVGPPPITSLDTWHELNYIINHKNGAFYWNVQAAINAIIGGPIPGPSPPYPPLDTNVVAAILADAAANAPTWQAQCGDKVAVAFVINTNPPVQLIFLEVPCCNLVFTKVPADTNLGCNPSNIPDCTGTVDTNIINATSCCGPVTLTCSKVDSMLNCANTRVITYVATDAAGNTISNSQTITWTTSTNKPSIQCPNDIMVTQSQGVPPPDTNSVSATAGCGAVKITWGGDVTNGICPQIIKRTYIATDACGNQNSCVQTITVLPNGMIGDYVWNDVNGNGCQDTNEPGIPGVTVNLYAGCPASGPAIATTTTDATGHYVFSNLCLGQYTVSFVSPAGYTHTIPNSGCVNSNLPPNQNQLDSKCTCDAGATCGICVMLTAANPINLNVDCGYVCNGQIGDYVWNDVNGNGCQDTNEPGIPGVTVNLYSGCGISGSPIATTTTDSTGHYLFGGLCAGTYTVSFITPTGYTHTTPLAGCVNSNLPPDRNQLDSKCSCGTASPCGVCVTLTPANPINLNVDCGYVCNGQIGDYVWNDANGNGCQDTNESGIPGVTVKLYSGCGTSGSPVATTTTDSTGHYLFSGLCFGTYTVSIVTPSGFTNTTANVGCVNSNLPPDRNQLDSKCNCGSSPCGICVTITPANPINLNVDCGYKNQGCPPCQPQSIAYNFNGTQIIFQPTAGGSYVWFISDGKVTGVSGKVNLHIHDQVITIPATGSSPQYTVPVPDSYITFDPSVTLATTIFDTVNNAWIITLPSSGLSGNVFYGGAAFKVPLAGLPGGIKNVLWTGQFTSDTPGLNISWQWHAAAYKNFTTDYNAIAPKPVDDNNASIYKNSDLAGTPEGIDSASGKQWKTFVEGGASGGGGANYTGSGSSTISFKPCVCQFTPPPPPRIGKNDTATIGFWHNQNGQAVILSFNGSSSSVALGNWLAGNYPCLFGNCSGKPNTFVAALFLTDFNVTGQKTTAQILATALAAYATSSNLSAPNISSKYGFNISSAGIGDNTYNVGSDGSVLGLVNNTSYTVFDLLDAANANCPFSTAAANALNDIFSGINQTGDIQ